MVKFMWWYSVLRFGSFAFKFWIDYLIQYDQMQSTQGLFLAVFCPLYELVDCETGASTLALIMSS